MNLLGVIDDSRFQLASSRRTLLAKVNEIDTLLCGHPDFPRGNSAVHFAVHASRAARSMFSQDPCCLDRVKEKLTSVDRVLSAHPEFLRGNSRVHLATHVARASVAIIKQLESPAAEEGAAAVSAYERLR